MFITDIRSGKDTGRTDSSHPGSPGNVRKGIRPARAAIAFGFVLAALVIGWTGQTGWAWAADQGYGYPYADPYVATVIGTPGELKAEVPGRISVSERELTVFEDRPVPDILWYGRKLRYSVALQGKEAPLIFLVPGLGAAYNESKNEFLQKVFFRAGFHVVALPSPSHPNFIPAASTAGIPGHPRDDAEDLYRVMELIVRDLRENTAISGFHLAGYSLGAVHAAFLGDLDRRRGLFRFGRVVMINPPVNLIASMKILDGMISEIPGGEEKFEEFFDQAFKAFAAIYRLGEPVDFTGDFLYRGRRPNDENLAALIGLSFRLVMANLVFTTDVFTDAGYIKPKHLRLSTTDSLTRYFSVADLVTFSDYYRDLLLPHLLEQSPGTTEPQLAGQFSLKSIEPFLGSPNVFLFHNADDVTLAPGDIDYISRVFGPRARIYPHGGHCGNLTYRENVADLLALFKDVAAAGEPPPILASDRSPAGPEPGEATPPPFTAPRPASAAATADVPKPGLASPLRKSEERAARKIITARRPYKEPVQPGLSYIIDVYDPIEPANRALYRFNALFDEYLFLPVTRAYEFVTPNFVQDRVSGIFSNISDVRNLTNAVLQFRPVRSGQILTRFLINSTIGLGGMWDPATGLGFPRRVEDFGQTLGRYGLGPGAYLILPVFGPSSLRDTTGLAADAAAQYFYLYQPTDMNENREWGIPYTAMNAVDTRHNIPFRYYQTGSPFEYDLLRLLYKKKRELDIEQ